jgi:hypothetical protein
MFRFSIAEMMIVVASVAVAAAGIAVPADSNRGIATLAAILMGFTIAGAPLLWWRRRTGALSQRWGLGELSWFYLGLYFLPLAVWSMVSPVSETDSERWLTIGFVISAAVCASAIVLGVGKLMLRYLGGYPSSGREWFSGRTTNLVGLGMLALYAGGGAVRLAWQSGWLQWLMG